MKSAHRFEPVAAPARIRCPYCDGEGARLLLMPGGMLGTRDPCVPCAGRGFITVERMERAADHRRDDE